MTNDLFHHLADSPTAPAERLFAIAPSDSQELAEATKAIYVGQAGDVVVRALASDADVTFASVPAGSILDIRVRRSLLNLGRDF